MTLSVGQVSIADCDTTVIQSKYATVAPAKRIQYMGLLACAMLFG